ncbi:hypothetical protein AB0A69_08315 [Streptomyces sp. NPDC045431]|uniref:hypothetical protein n=1 Tax=Streptomyces sp. NPDC045431 TaxID=3155613 RepID=UPI0033CA9E0C
MLADVMPEQLIATFGITCVTYFPRSRAGRLHAATADFLANVGLPSLDADNAFSSRDDLDDAARLTCTPSLRAALEHPLHADVSSLAQSLILLEGTKKECKGLPTDEAGYQARMDAVDRLKRCIAHYDETPLGPDSPWSALLDEMALGMWG